MSSPISSRLFKGGIVSIDPDSGALQRRAGRQHSLDTPARSFLMKDANAEGRRQSEALRWNGLPVELFKLGVKSHARRGWSL
jgi:hypothetical protein